MRINFNNWSIKYKITSLITIVFLIAFVSLSYFIYQFSKNEFYSSAQNQIKLISRVLGESNTATILFRDSTEAKKTLMFANLIEALTQAEILDNESNIIASYQSKNASEFLNFRSFSNIHKDTIIDYKQYFIDIHPVVLENDTIGKVIVTHDKTFFQTKFKKFIFYQFFIFLIIFIAAFFIVLFMQRFITRPINALIKTMRQVTKNNNYSMTLKSKGNDELGEMILVFNHMLEHIKLQSNELIQSKEKAINLAGTKDRFLAQMSHEIRTPLNAIFGFITLFEKTNLNNEQKMYLEYVRLSLENLGGIINDILDFSKIEAGQLEIEKKDFNLKNMLNDIVHMFEPKAKSKNIKFRLTLEKNVPTIVKSDKLRLYQILVNLISNAIKFTDEGIVELNVKAKHINSNLFNVTFSVIDSGIGIAPEMTKHIFEDFKQASGSISLHYGGTGLGLSISKRLVELLNGKLSVESVKDKGSTFYFSLDLEGNDKIMTPEKNVLSEKEATNDIFKRQLKILVAEDNKLNQILIQKILKNFNIEVELVVNGKEAITRVEDKDFDIIFMDIQMPEMNGFEATEYIRSHFSDVPKKQSIPIIALSAAVTEAERTKAKHLGMNYFIAKPFKEHEIINTIKKALNE